MSIEIARAHLEKFGLADRIREFTVSSATVALAAEALGCEPAHIAKSLTFGKEGGVLSSLRRGMPRWITPNSNPPSA
jgi:prolyl-tRNA editing enzyme YbaK/EbsC (Cys-tRNA(Pro) deacylase)